MVGCLVCIECLKKISFMMPLPETIHAFHNSYPGDQMLIKILKLYGKKYQSTKVHLS